MDHVSYTELRRNLTHYMDEAVDDRVTVVVVRQPKRGNVVIMSEEEFRGWQETIHLLSSPVNAAHVLRAIRDTDDNKSVERDLVEPKVAAML